MAESNESPVNAYLIGILMDEYYSAKFSDGEWGAWLGVSLCAVGITFAFFGVIVSFTTVGCVIALVATWVRLREYERRRQHLARRVLNTIAPKEESDV